MSADAMVTHARRALDLLARGALYERRPGLRVAVMANLGAVAEAVEALARLQGELAAAGEAVAGARAEAATMARACREEVALLRGRLELAQKRVEELEVCVDEARRTAMREADLRMAAARDVRDLRKQLEGAEQRADDAAVALGERVGA